MSLGRGGVSGPTTAWATPDPRIDTEGFAIFLPNTTAMPSGHRTPLRRVSQGSLSALARSGTYPPGPTGLEFLEPAMDDLADEAATLHSNLEGLNALSDSLGKFNEAFASYLYAMRMNAFCVEWHQVRGHRLRSKPCNSSSRFRRHP